MESYLLFIIKKIKHVFSPAFIYTLDRTVDYTTEINWVFKEYGTHTFVKKSWAQLKDGDFLRQVNPRDIALIAEIEAIRKINSDKFYISKEGRMDIWTLTSKGKKITITGQEFIKDREIVNCTDVMDASRIAYHTGFKKGREIAEYLSTPSLSKKEGGKPTLTIIK
ncbi:hypothetical protein [Symbiopectobacterium purcellii]|uniref:Uncharacterized protein n=1 Tax=Symbiopectobacterium purcellii TaxID=2871826 RepID=A0ABX9AR79_9ENTR|nr:hypothetical protein [Symbiopectobacterium purcellii]QZN95964.1 hypothetical protein K6K13_00175 [Symbiopectobacterium purcellii]